MSREYSIYCDESCHLEHDHQPVMTLGAIWCPTSKRIEIHARLSEIKRRYGLSHAVEMKWQKISPRKLQAYLDLVDYFFDDDDLHFRVLVVPDKSKLDHQAFRQTHNEWYYKMYFDLLKNIISNNATFNIFIDIKDTIGGEKIRQLNSILAHSQYDFDRRVIRRMQIIRSEEVGIMQLVDILTGATMAANRGNIDSSAKLAIIDRIKQRSKYSLDKSTLLSEQKFNIFVWRSQG